MAQLQAFCHLPWTRVKVQCNGDINMCCHQTFRFIGNLFENDFNDIWFGEVAQEIRSEVLADRLHHNCDTAECPFRYLNRVKRPVRNNVNGLPNDLELDIHASHCNFGGLKADSNTTCIMCPRAEPNTKLMLQTVPDRTLEIADRLKHLMPYLKSLCIMGLTEPFWKGRVFDVFDVLDFKSHRNHISFWTNTNGSLFDDAMSDRFVEYVKTSRLHFSLDAATPETFFKIRKNKVFDRILSNINAWNAKRIMIHENKTGRHMLRIQNNINNLNVEELPAMVSMAAEIGVDQLILSPTHDMNGYNSQLHDIMPQPKDVLKYKVLTERAKRLAKEAGLDLWIMRPLWGDAEELVVKLL